MCELQVVNNVVNDVTEYSAAVYQLSLKEKNVSWNRTSFQLHSLVNDDSSTASDCEGPGCFCGICSDLDCYQLKTTNCSANSTTKTKTLVHTVAMHSILSAFSQYR